MKVNAVSKAVLVQVLVLVLVCVTTVAAQSTNAAVQSPANKQPSPVQSPPPSPKQSPQQPQPQPQPQPQSPAGAPRASSLPSPAANAPNFATQTTSSVDFMNCNKRDVLALTFDDGPHGSYTGPLLDTLKSLNVKATWFMMGQHIEQNQDVTKRIYDEGHQIASHTWSHPHLPRLNAGEVRSEMQRTEDILKRLTGVSVAHMRPPYGESTDETLGIMHSMGYLAVTWNLDTNDWQGLDSSLGFRQLLNPGYANGYISLQHDIQGPSVTPEKIRDIVNIGRSRGFTFVTVAECIGRQPYKEGWGNVARGGVTSIAANTTTIAPTTTEVSTTIAVPTETITATANVPIVSNNVVKSGAIKVGVTFSAGLVAALFLMLSSMI